ncbi:MAG: family 20 glycosylhydrolase, partial [Ferruginibacter sp.]
KHDVIMTPGGWCYFDHSQSKYEDSVTIGGYLPLDKVYGYEPIPAALNVDEAKYVLGAQANLWTEYIGNEQKLQYMVFPRIAALAEVLWTPKEKRNWSDFEKRLPAVFKKLDEQNINYSTAYYNLQINILPTHNNEGVLATIESNIKSAAIKYTMEPGQKPIDYTTPILIKKSTTNMSAFSLVNGKKATTVYQTININDATGKKITLTNQPSKSYPGDGAFTLVDGVQNKSGLQRTSELLGFNGQDIGAIVDLGKTIFIHEINLHVFQQPESWIYPPTSVSFYSSSDSVNFKLLETVTNTSQDKNLVYTTKLTEPARFIKIVAKNAGIIPAGNAGAGNPAWLFADEIEVK